MDPKPSSSQGARNVCIIHQDYVKKEETLLTPITFESWEALLEAAKVRKHKPILDVAANVQDRVIPPILYHRQCRGSFTHKRTLVTLKRKSGEVGEGTSAKTSRPSRESSSASRVYVRLCIFCKTTKYVKGKRTREYLVQARQLRTDVTLRDIARQKEDKDILAITSRDIVAAEAHYHRSCYKSYIREKSRLHHKPPQHCKTDGDIAYGNTEKEAYTELFQFIRNDVIPKPEVISMTSLMAKLEVLMKAKGVQELKISTKKNFRRKLEATFGSILHIFPDSKGKLLIVPEHLNLEDVVKENYSLKQEVDLWKSKSSEISHIIDQASSHLRSQIKKQHEEEVATSSWPYYPSDVSLEALKIPQDLKRFFLGLLTDNPDNKKPSQRAQILLESFSQDFIYAVTCGKSKPPKHILLSYAVKTLTGNVELIRTLNRLGHGISYHQLQENDTALCLQKIASVENERSGTPESILRYIFTCLAWDNIDKLEETPTGGGTTHRVNGIAVQTRVFGPQLPKPARPRVDKTKQRTINPGEQTLPTYIAGERVGPHPLKTEDTDEPNQIREAHTAKIKNLIWIIARQIHPVSQEIPSWTGFNIGTRELNVAVKDTIGYLPTINAPATHLTTVNEILNKSDLIRKELQLRKIVVVMDQALYAKAAEIAWKHREKFANIILRMGIFHTICNVLSIIGKRFQDAGLRDICIESDIVAEGSVTGVLEGKMYNRAVRVHKCIYEAMLRLAWKEFLSWVELNHQTQVDTLNTLLDEVSILEEDLCKSTFDEILQSPGLLVITDLWCQFLEHLRRNNGDLSTFWMTYIDIVGDILLGLIRSAREGNWHLHMFAIRAMIPWCFAYDKMNYARYLPAYYAEMTNIPTNHPEVYQNFLDGYFTVQMSNHNPFGRIPVDQATEETVNKDTKTPGGTNKFSLKVGAVNRFYLTAEYRSGFLSQMRNMIRVDKTGSSHPDLQKPKIDRDEKAVTAVESLIEDWTNPFAESQNLVSISTAKEAPADVRNDLMRAYDVGEQCYKQFKGDRLETDPPKQKFHDKMKMNKLKSFTTMGKKKEIKSNGRAIILKADRSLFGRMIVMGQSRQIHMKDMLSHPLGPLPWALASHDGYLRKTNKATLAAGLQKDVNPAEVHPTNSATIIDGMSFVQKVKGEQPTFGDIAAFIFSMILKEGSQSSRIDVVFDVYKEQSIKNTERAIRGQEYGLQLHNITATQRVKQWKKFLSKVENKTSLIQFLAKEWKTPKYSEELKDRGKFLYVTCEENCWRVTGEGSTDIPALTSCQEEADGRLLLHAAHASEEGYNAVVICAEDTDVFLLALAFNDSISASLFQKCGTKTRTRLVDIGKVAATIGADTCKALLGMHAFTGCDTVSTFAGRGKLNALKILKSDTNVKDMFAQVGQHWILPSELFSELEKFTCQLYTTRPSTNDINELRYNLFCAKNGDIESHQLPPCRDSLLKHATRANYQAAIWRRSLEANPEVPSPIGFGWKIEKVDDQEELVVDWMTGQPAPEVVLEMLACKCTRSCKLPNCVCLANGLKCTDMCRLTECDNQASDDEAADERPQDDQDEYDEFDY